VTFSALLPRSWVEIVKRTERTPLEAAKVVMLRAVAAADTHPTHGVFTRADITSLFVLISTPALPDANDAASAFVVRPLQVTVTAPAGTEPVDKVMVIASLENAEAHVIKGDITPHVLAEAEMRVAGNVSVILSVDDKAVDVVNVTVADAVADAIAVVMLRAVAAADTHPMHGTDR